MIPFRIIAVDPGKNSGLFVFDGTRVSDSVEGTPFNVISDVDRLLHMYQDVKVYVIVERYTITQAHISPQYDALETIGALRYLTQKWEQTFRLQSRSDKSRVSDDDLRKIGWYRRTAGGDVNDAARHAFIALARMNPAHELVQRLLDTVDVTNEGAHDAESRRHRQS
jgi:hypothetical protein